MSKTIFFNVATVATGKQKKRRNLFAKVTNNKK